MPYPYTWTDPDTLATVNSYASVATVQEYFSTYTITDTASQSDHIGTTTVQDFLAEATAQVDAVLMKAGYLVPPPAGAAILPILKQTAAIGAAANLEWARYEAGDENLGAHANGLRNAFDGQLGLIERQDGLNCGQLGMVSAGWAQQADETKYFASGNLLPDYCGNQKQANFVMSRTDW